MNDTFIPYETALSILEENKGDFPVENRNLEDCIGSFLAEDLVADRDFPPFDRVTMDGIAIAYERFHHGQRKFKIASIAAAGSPQQSLADPKNCMEVMTGAIMPKGVDTVIRYEDLNVLDDTATIAIDTVRYRQNVHFKGSDLLKGTTIVAKGKQLSSAEVNIAASIGKSRLQVKKLPKTIIFSTGDELVAIDQSPKLHQIRRSNVYGIQATLKEWGISADLQHLADDKLKMEKAISKSLENYDVLVFTGGVSKGKFDYLPEVLETLKVKKHFHKVQQRPGKPFWFGTNEAGRKIFALPGNPVSSFVCVYVYLKYWLTKSLGITEKPFYVQLKKDVKFAPDLVYFLEASLESDKKGKSVADPKKGNGSGDFANLVQTDGFFILPQGKSEFKKGEAYPFVRYRNVF